MNTHSQPNQNGPQPVTRDAFPADDPRYRFPDTISPQAVEGFAALHQIYSQPVPIPRSLAEWDEQHALIEQGNLRNMPRIPHQAAALGGVNVIRLPATALGTDQPILIYVHGGGHTWLSARSTLIVAALMSRATGYEIVSVDYTVAPRGRWQQQTAEVISVYRALIAEGHKPERIGIFGDSAGGGLTAGSVLRMRDEGLPLPGALLLLSPWSDVTGRGDSYMTLASFDPMLTYGELKVCADAYAAPTEQCHPYVSPIYGDYSKPFPPTMIQGGTRELLLSDFVRHYQAIRSHTNEAVLDLYEGMAHGFHVMAPYSPEVQRCFATAATFWNSRLPGKQDATSHQRQHDDSRKNPYAT